MEAVSEFFSWLFATRQGVLFLVVGGILLFVIIACALEIQTRRRFKNYKKQEGDFDLFDDSSESGWSDFEEDNK